MANIEITNNDVGTIDVWNAEFQDAIALFTTGETWPAGSVLAKVTASGKYVRFDSTGNDGSETPIAVLTQPLTAASAGDIPFRPMISGQVRSGKLVDEDDAVLDAAQLDMLRDYTIVALKTTERASLDNQ